MVVKKGSVLLVHVRGMVGGEVSAYSTFPLF